jgi:positive regulator of sigma E activity
MQQRATVLETDGKIALIKVSRASMCEGCHKFGTDGGCGGHCEITGLVAGNGKTMTARAQNNVGAATGDRVEVESDSVRVIGYAALVFILPIIVGGLFYWIGNMIFSHSLGAVLSSALGFALSFFGIAVFDKMKRNKLPDIKITKILTESSDGQLN